jgi:quercetin dioxygenase-like cupin family protein
MTPHTRLGFAVAALASLCFAAGAGAQSSPVHKTTLQDQPFPAPVYHTVTVRTLVDGGGLVPRHTHPGLEMGYVLQGRATLMIQGQPPRPLVAGDSFAIPARTIHSVRNDAPATLIMLSTYVVEQGQPIASPAPAK